jgi:hypothetical protein
VVLGFELRAYSLSYSTSPVFDPLFVLFNMKGNKVLLWLALNL